MDALYLQCDSRFWRCIIRLTTALDSFEKAISMYKPDISKHEASIFTYNGAISPYHKITSPYHKTVPHMTKWLLHVSKLDPDAITPVAHDTEPVAHTMKSVLNMTIRPASIAKTRTHTGDSFSHIWKRARAVTKLDTGISILDSQIAGLANGTTKYTKHTNAFQRKDARAQSFDTDLHGLTRILQPRIGDR